MRRGVEVTALEDTGDGVLVGTTAGTVRTGWLVGCDGGHSAVRRLAGIDFPGTDPELTGYQAVVDIADPEKLANGWTWSSEGAYRYGPQPGRVATMEFDDRPADRSAPVTLEQLQTSLRRVSGTDVTLTALRAAPTRWTDNTRQAATYRSGRVLLAGDAAHVHPPFGGQGLNLGVGDAMNLGWKLGAVVTGWAPAGCSTPTTPSAVPSAPGYWTGRGPRSGCCAGTPSRPRCGRSWPICWALGTAPPTRSRRSPESPAHRAALHHPLVGRYVPDLWLATAPGSSTTVTAAASCCSTVLPTVRSPASPRAGRAEADELRDRSFPRRVVRPRRPRDADRGVGAPGRSGRVGQRRCSRRHRHDRHRRARSRPARRRGDRHTFAVREASVRKSTGLVSDHVATVTNMTSAIATDYAIEAIDLVKEFGGSTPAVDGVSFNVPPGSVMGLLGPNGAGKTTIVRMMTTLTPTRAPPELRATTSAAS